MKDSVFIVSIFVLVPSKPEETGVRDFQQLLWHWIKSLKEDSRVSSEYH